MAYTPTTWVDGVTKLGPTNLNHLETGLQTAAAVADSATTTAGAAVPKSTITTAADLIVGTGNAAVTRLGVGAAGQVLAVVGGVLTWVYPPGFEINHTQITSNATVTDTSESTATALISPGAITFDGTAVVVEFNCPAVTIPSGAGTNFLIVTLFEGATQIARLAALQTVGALVEITPVCVKYRFTPTAASHTYKICAFVSSTTGTPLLNAGAGGTASYAPTFVRFTKA